MQHAHKVRAVPGGDIGWFGDSGDKGDATPGRQAICSRRPDMILEQNNQARSGTLGFLKLPAEKVAHVGNTLQLKMSCIELSPAAKLPQWHGQHYDSVCHCATSDFGSGSDKMYFLIRTRSGRSRNLIRNKS